MTTAKSILFPKSTTIDPSLFLVPAPYHPIISSSPMFPSPTCPLRSAPRTILSSFDTLSSNPSRSFQKSFFSFMLLLTCGSYALTIFRMEPLPPASWPLVCLTHSSPPGHFQPAPTLRLSLSHFFFHQLRCKIVCVHLQCSLLYSLSTLFPVGTICLHSFAPSYLPALFPFHSFLLIFFYILILNASDFLQGGGHSTMPPLNTVLWTPLL